jgi:hypothetical protein
MKRLLIWLTLVAALAIGFALYRSRTSGRFNVTPEAERAIEKAMRH